MNPQHPTDEIHRLEALASLRALETPAEERFDGITRLSERVFDVPIAMVSLVDASREWLKACPGLLPAPPGDITFCGHAILQQGSTVIPDARMDARFEDNPLVTDEPFIRFYAGHPLRAPDGRPVGTLSIVDRRPRQMREPDLQALRDLAHLAENELHVMRLSQGQIDLVLELREAQRQAFTDVLTRLWNRAGILEIFQREVARARALNHPIGVLMLDIDSFKRINDTYGHPAGDAVLRECAHRLRMAVRPQDAAGRYGGDEFLILMAGCDLQRAVRAAGHVSGAVNGAGIVWQGARIGFTISCGAAAGSGSGTSLNALLQEADAALYLAKRALARAASGNGHPKGTA